jgi:hypothetical protein
MDRAGSSVKPSLAMELIGGSRRPLLRNRSPSATATRAHGSGHRYRAAPSDAREIDLWAGGSEPRT